eukprot:164659-Pleurochrysis_carterae.AAC.6
MQRVESRDVRRGRPPPEPVEPAPEPGAGCAVVAAGGVAHDAPHKVVVRGGYPRRFRRECCEDRGARRVGQHVLPGRQPLSHLRPDAYSRVCALVELGACHHRRRQAFHSVPSAPGGHDEGLQEAVELSVALDEHVAAECVCNVL